MLGFCNMLWKLLRDMPEDDRPTHLAIIFDKSEITFRNKLYPDYKAHRPPAPDDLIPQFALIREAVRAFDLPCLEQVGFEADDLIATYARLAGERGATTTIVSSDKDLMQLVTDKVTMYDTMKDRRIGIPEVIEKFGVPPEKVVEVQALAGDSTDNVPGVPGIGVKTAAQLIVEYGDLEQLLFRAGEIKQPKRRESLIENAEKARISRQLVLLDDKVDLEVPLDDLAVHEPDARKLIAFLKAMEFSTLTRRVAEYSQIDPSDVEADAGNKSGASVFAVPPSGEKPEGYVEGATLFDAPAAPSAKAEPRAARMPTSRTRPRARRARRSRWLPHARKPRENSPSTAANTRPSATPPNSRHGSRARTMPAVSRSTSSRTPAIRCRPTSAASRWRWRRTTPVTCRSPTARPVTARACSTPGSRPTRSSGKTPRPRSSRCWNRPRHSQDRLQHQVQRGDAGAARHHVAQYRRRAADVVRARRRAQLACAGIAGRALVRSCRRSPKAN